MKNIKKALLIVLILLVQLSLYAVSFSSSILSVSSDAHLFSCEGNGGFFGGFFPLEAEYRYKTALPAVLKDNGFSLNLDFNSGIKERLLKVNPETGEVLSEGERASSLYQIHYIYFDLDFSKAIISEPYLDEDILSVHFSIYGDYENAYERFTWLDNPVNTDGVFLNYVGTPSKPFEDKYNSYEFVPEVKGKRMMAHTGFGLSAVFNWKEETAMTKDGLWGSAEVKYMPSWMPFHDDSASNYVALYLNAGAAFTLLEMSQMSFGPTTGLDALSVYIETEFDAIGAWGNDIPQYAVERRVWNTDVPSSHIIVANTTSLVINGFQIKKDLYPSITIFNDIAFGFGGGINGTEGGNGFVGSVGARLDFNIFSMFSLYGEVGFVYKDLYNRNPGLRYALGAKVRV